jgi:ABC-type oligopeptide transport system substrate-binding subunit/tRNA A-37 threonylcarbamoyl transferase component Bud32
MMTIQSGTLIHGRYRLEAETGRGGMAVVYRARDEKLQRSVAVKVLSESGLGTAGRARLIHEAQSAAQLNHPNIVTVHDVGEVEGTTFIVMELVEGGSLHDHRPESASEIVLVARQICLALEHAHAQGIVHRDLKPENVLLSVDGAVKLTDFGLALSIASRTTSEGAIAGTVFYLAPEQALGQPLDGRADLYALGVILYELVAGRLPFVAEEPLAVVSQHLYTPVVPPSTYDESIPSALEALILLLLAKRPEDRPPSAAEVGRLLETLDLAAGRGPTASMLERIARGRLVGREHELQQARALWQKVTAGVGQVLLVSGEPGVGKTRLIRELAAQAAVSGGCVLMGECYAGSGGPYAPVAQMIQQAVDGRTPEELGLPEFVLADLIALAPILRARHPAVLPNPPADPRTEQQRRADSVVLLLSALSRRGPVLLVLEDAHWADGASLALLHHVARRSHQPETRLMTVLTYREVELDEARSLNEVLLDLDRERLATRLKLARLSHDETRDLLAVLFQEEITPEFLDGIYRETEGNPFFVEEVCKAFIEQGVLTREGGRWHRPSMSEIHVPQSLRVAMQSRLSRLPDGAQEMLRRAAIIGREFDHALLQTVCDLEDEALIEALEAAERAQLIEEVHRPGEARSASPRFSFVHALIPHTLAEGISGLRKQRLHRRVAEGLETIGAARLDELAETIGRHFAEAAEWDRAVEYLVRAGDHATLVYAYPEAIADYEEALGILRERKDYEPEARLQIKLGSLYHSIFDFARSRRAYQEGFARWHEAGASASRAPRPSSARTLTFASVSPRTLDPGFSGWTDEALLIDHIFAGLLERTPEMDLVPDLARSWEIGDDGLSYVFRLREDATWTDGTSVTAGDVEFAWKRILDPRSGSPNAPLLDCLKGARAFRLGEKTSEDELGVRAVDDATLHVQLEAPCGFFLHLLACPGMYAVPRRVVEAKGSTWWQPENIITCGPFEIRTWVPGEQMRLSRYDKYHGRFLGNLDAVDIRLVHDWNLRLDYDLFQAGEVSVAGVPDEKFADARRQYPGQLSEFPAASSGWIGLDTAHAPFDDVRVRQALAHGLDREALANEAFRGSFPAATGGIVPPGFPGHHPGIGLPYDLERARILLRQAGFPEGRGFPSLAMLVTTPQKDSAWLRNVIAQWSKLGLSIHGEALAPREYEERLHQDPPALYAQGWVADYPDPDNFLRVALWALPSTSWNQEYHESVQTAATSAHPATRHTLYERAETILVQQAAVIPFLYGRFLTLLKPWVKTWPHSPVRSFFLKDAIVEST